MDSIFSAIEWVFSYLCSTDFAIVLVALFVSRCIVEWLTKKGPMLWPLLGMAPSFILNINNTYDWATRELIKYRGTFPYRGVWLGKCSGIVTANPSNIEHMLKTKFHNYPKGKYYRERFGDLLGDGIFNADDDLWKEQRRIANSEMHSKRFVQHSLKTTQDLVNKNLLRVTEMLVNSKQAFDMQDLLLRFTFDNICAAAFGVNPGCLREELPEIPFAKAFEEATELTMFRFMVPPYVWKPMKVLGIGHEKKLRNSVKIVRDFADETVKDRRNEFKKLGSLHDRSDLLSRVMELEAHERILSHGEQFPDVFLRDFCISFILAGRDTTSVALAWFFWLVHKNPDVEKKILGEIYQIMGKRTWENEVNFTEEDLKKMVYLHAALSESLRLYPSVPVDIKEAQEDDIFPDGTKVKKGERVFYFVFSMGKMESIWGEDCLQFKPERWLKDGEFVSENQFKFPAFNGGPRLCVGKKFAYMQMKMVAASILLKYSVRVVEEHPIVPKVTTTLYMKNGFLVTLEPRLLDTSVGV